MHVSITLIISPAFNVIATSDYYMYGSNNLSVNSVNIQVAACNPSGTFGDCVNMEIQNQGCSDGLLASVACPGML